MIRVTVLVRDHTNDRVALDLCDERAADTTICASREHRPVGLPELVQGFLHQGRRRASLNTRAARHALRLHEWLHLTGRDFRIEAAAIDGESIGSLDFFA